MIVSTKACFDSHSWSTIVISDFEGIELPACNFDESFPLFLAPRKDHGCSGTWCVYTEFRVNENRECEKKRKPRAFKQGQT
jgi:hypothetical protein